MRKAFLLCVLFSFLLLNGCTKDENPVGAITDNSDIPADPGTPPPAPKEGPLKPAVTVTPAHNNPSRIQLNVGGLLDSEGNSIVYTSGNLTVVEDGVVKGIKVTTLGTGGLTLKSDIAFIIDVTGSMGEEIDTVKNSILAFVRELRSRGLDIQCGAVAYSDNNDYPIAENGLPDTDPAAYVVVGSQNLTAQLDSAGNFYKFIDSLGAGWKGYYGGDWPEGGFDALWHAYRKFSWRPDASKIFIVLTDAPTWGKYAPSYSGTTRSPWRTDSLAAVLSGNATVHVVCPDTNDYSLKQANDGYNLGVYDMRWLAIPGSFKQNGQTYISGGTGGLWIDLYGSIDLSKIPIKEAMSGSALVEYVTTKKDGTEKTIRVIVDIGSSNGEVTVKATY